MEVTVPDSNHGRPLLHSKSRGLGHDRLLFLQLVYKNITCRNKANVGHSKSNRSNTIGLTVVFPLLGAVAVSKKVQSLYA
jgi:hypothetical protein